MSGTALTLSNGDTNMGHKVWMLARTAMRLYMSVLAEEATYLNTYSCTFLSVG